MRSVNDADRGAGLVGTIFGVVTFWAFVLFAAQLLVNLASASVVTSAAYDAARIVASAREQPPTPIDVARADAHVRRLLAGYDQPPELDWDLSDPDVVRLRVRVHNPRLLWAALDGPLGFDVIDRTVTVRLERLR